MRTIRLTHICAISCLAVLGGCPQTTRTVTDTYCQVYEPIRASRLDTPETLKQVKRQNRAYDALCKAAMKQAAESMLK